ncbi:alpha/beta hydrolase family protein [Kaistella montana]|uniref:Alpha/beta hydrolase family protein n=1 Tax=Kaistella montana TaxID=1849733 RepID=A0ABW5KAG8_9FLAO|nr:alpha/beta hydrolase family protein [Kaistella montana]MCQ4034971.1 alpha/beta hydrolase [Kaistella montana]
MKLYVISGLGADFKVLEKIKFPANLEVVFIPWLIPEKGEHFADYVTRMAEKIDDSAPFYLLGYSFGGIMVQEIDKIKPSEKIVILGSIKSDKEKSGFIKLGELTRLPKYLPENIFTEKTALSYSFLRKLIDPKNPKIMDYFTVRNPYYLKWSFEKISAWKFQENPKVIQILADKDIVFPIKYSKPNFVIENGTHLFPATKYREVSAILNDIFTENSEQI